MRTVSVVHNVFKTENNALYIIPAYKESKKKAVSQEKSRLTAFLCPNRSQCCTNYNEPTGNLDTQSSLEVMGLLKQTSQRFCQTIVMITHNMNLAQMADRIIRIQDGKIIDA